MAGCNCAVVCTIVIAILSIFYFILGLSLVGIASIVKFFPSLLAFLEGDDSTNIGLSVFVMLVTAGVLLSVASILGCCIGCNKRVGLLIFFIVAVVISIILQIVAVIMVKDTIDKLINRATGDAVKDFQDPMGKYFKLDAEKAKVDLIQKDRSCCGYNGYSDWQKLATDLPDDKESRLILDYIPQSCCKISSICNTKLDVHQKGCKGTYMAGSFFKDIIALAFSVGSSSSIIFQLIGVVLAIVTVILLRKGQTDDRGQFIPMSNQTSL